MPMDRETFDAQRRPRFGTSNPERMNLAFWEWMIRGDNISSPTENGVLGELGLMMRNGILKSSYGPYRARDLFQIPMNRDDGPIWTFDRMGATRTELPDGRVVCIGGEHEDYYDPDFHIYNDVVVFSPPDAVEIYGYPKDLFPPTDFHTASLVGEAIIIVGGLGYPDDRHPGHTPVFSLSRDYHIMPITTSGLAPGRLFKHSATVGDDEVLRITGGELWVEHNGKKTTRKNIEDYSLDLKSGVWKRLTDHNWCQYRIQREDRGWFSYPDTSIDFELLAPDMSASAQFIGVADKNEKMGYFKTETFGFASVELIHQCVEIAVMHCRISEDADRFAEQVRTAVENISKAPCVIEKLT